MKGGGARGIGIVLFGNGIELRRNGRVVFEIAKGADGAAADPGLIIRIQRGEEQLGCGSAVEPAERVGGDGANSPGFVVAQRLSKSSDGLVVVLHLAKRDDGICAIVKI